MEHVNRPRRCFPRQWDTSNSLRCFERPHRGNSVQNSDLQRWPHFELCLFICSSDMNDSSVIWLVLLLYKSSYKRQSIIHFLLLFQLNVFYNVMNVRRSLRRRDIHTDEAFYLDIDVMDNDEFNVNLHICFRWAAVIYLLAPKHGIKMEQNYRII